VHEKARPLKCGGEAPRPTGANIQPGGHPLRARGVQSKSGVKKRARKRETVRWGQRVVHRNLRKKQSFAATHTGMGMKKNNVGRSKTQPRGGGETPRERRGRREINIGLPTKCQLEARKNKSRSFHTALAKKTSTSLPFPGVRAYREKCPTKSKRELSVKMSK